jgi:N-acetyllactosaminide 3-alpha-galactosyltransferase/rhamnosyl/mannosyltransferase
MLIRSAAPLRLGLDGKFSRNALERFKEFEINSVADKILNLYKEVLKC